MLTLTVRSLSPFSPHSLTRSRKRDSEACGGGLYWTSNVDLISEVVNLPQEKVEKGIADGTFVDSAWKGHQLACTTMASIKQVTDKHSLLDVSPSAVERLHALQVYPIILFVKFKSPKHIRFVKTKNLLVVVDSRRTFYCLLQFEFDPGVFSVKVPASSPCASSGKILAAELPSREENFPRTSTSKLARRLCLKWMSRIRWSCCNLWIIA